MEIQGGNLIIETKDIRDAIQVSERVKLSEAESWKYLLRGLDLKRVQVIRVMLRREMTNIEKRYVKVLLESVIPDSKVEIKEILEEVRLLET